MNALFYVTVKTGIKTGLNQLPVNPKIGYHILLS